MKSAIMAVTKSAYATFHAPPWWPACATFFLMMIGVTAILVSSCVRISGFGPFQSLLQFLKTGPSGVGDRATAELQGHLRRSTFQEGNQRDPHGVIKLAFLLGRFSHLGCHG